MDRDERDITGMVYMLMVIELGWRATCCMINQNTDDGD